MSKEMEARALCRRTAAALLHCMAGADLGFEDIDDRLDRKRWSRGRVRRLSDGKPVPLDDVSNIALACGAELKFSVREIPELAEPPAAEHADWGAAE